MEELLETVFPVGSGELVPATILPTDHLSQSKM
jgi:hypothetical protein